MWMKISTTTFSAVSSVSVDNCFSAAYRHYLVLRDMEGDVLGRTFRVQLRSGGVTATGTNYREQDLGGGATTLYGNRVTGATSWALGLGYSEATSIGASIFRISSPFQSQITTAWSDYTYAATGNIEMYRQSRSHDLASSYDGMTVSVNAGSMTGSFTVYGLRES